MVKCIKFFSSFVMTSKRYRYQNKTKRFYCNAFHLYSRIVCWCFIRTSNIVHITVLHTVVTECAFTTTEFNIHITLALASALALTAVHCAEVSCIRLMECVKLPSEIEGKYAIDSDCIHHINAGIVEWISEKCAWATNAYCVVIIVLLLQYSMGWFLASVTNNMILFNIKKNLEKNENADRRVASCVVQAYARF